MSKYKGLFTFDEDNHRYVPIAQSDGIIDAMDYKPAEPLIKDEKIRKAVRAWADANELEPKYTAKYHSSCYVLSSWQGDIEFNSPIKGLEDEKVYTIAELCGDEGQ